MEIGWRKLLKYKNNIAVGEKVPRKIKKQILGNKLSRNKLRKRISKLEVKIYKYPNGYSVPYTDEEFCPKCGCEEHYSSGQMAEYPETWIRHYCLRCGELVEEEDNSAMVHQLVYIVQEMEGK